MCPPIITVQGYYMFEGKKIMIETSYNTLLNNRLHFYTIIDTVQSGADPERGSQLWSNIFNN
jgi:hypothetical protein